MHFSQVTLADRSSAAVKGTPRNGIWRESSAMVMVVPEPMNQESTPESRFT